MNKAEVEALERRVKEEFELDMAAIRRVQVLLSRNGSAPAPMGVSESDHGNDESAEGETLIGRVERVFVSDPKRTWTIPKIEKHLRDSGFTLAAKNPKPSIAVAVKKLIVREVVRLFKKGGGKSPHIYKAAEKRETDNE